MAKPLTAKQKKNLVRGIGTLARAFVRGASAVKKKPNTNTNLAGMPAAKPGCGPCGPRSK